jgi:hypothetical protein
MEVPMSDATPLSPLRRVLCSHSNAIRVAAWMRRAGIETDIVATGAPLQPWRVIEANISTPKDTRVCA